MEHPFVPLEFNEIPPREMERRAREYFLEMNSRRTVREFAARPVAREVVTEVIRAAGTAPSGAHKQPWHYVLVGDPKVKQSIRESAEIEERESYERRMPQTWLDDLKPLGTDWQKPFLTVCPWLIIAFSHAYGIGSEGQKTKNYYVQESMGISLGFLLAGLHHAGLATLTHTPSPMGFLQKILNRPRNEKAYMLIAVGYPEKGCQVPDLERKPLDEFMTEV